MAQESIRDEIIKRWESAQGAHGAFVRHYERGERAYRGVLSSVSDAAKWRHKYHPPYAFNLIETIVSNMVDQGLQLSISPAPRPGLTQQEAIQLLQQVDALQSLLRQEHRIDEMDAKQRPLFLTEAIGGRGVLKSYWNYSTGPIRQQGVKMHTVEDGMGGTIAVPQVTEVEIEGIVHDHSTAEVVDPRDFVVHESARTLDPCKPGGAQYLFHRCWYSFEQLKAMEAGGFFSGVDALKDSRDFSGSEYSDRETQVFKANRQKDLIELLEYWKYEDGQVWRAYLANRQHVLRDIEANPFWHGLYPFILCSSMPQPFSTIGMSDIELVSEIQEMLWELGNHRLDNVELIANAIYLIRSDVQDPEAFEFYPGARWQVEDANQVQALAPPYQLIDATINQESLLKGDMQNVTSATPFAGGADSQSVDNNTATGASIVMNAAQQRLSGKKYEAQRALCREAWMRIKNCQQFLSDKVLLHENGPSGSKVFRSLDPLDIQGEFAVELEAMGESDMRQERRAEANQVLTQMQQLYVNSYVSGHPIDLQQVILWWARQWGMEDEIAAFFQPQQQPDPSMVAYLTGNAPKVQLRGEMDVATSDTAAQAQGLPPSQMPPGAGGIGGGVPQVTDAKDVLNPPNMGVTAGSAVDASSPSAAGGMSSSPILALQRALAMSGAAKK